ncbi:MAG: dienelactone hydrolase family protein [Gammaproteobacteria bacterium]|nr:dienelactone hydrolase family protein [Gammaproteobacteria bacterium]
MKNSWVLLLILGFASTHAAIQDKEIVYQDGDTVLKGYLAYDDIYKGKRPAVLVVHEWWGHNDYARKRARMLAGLGYTALAVDMYGDGKQASHPDDAGKFAGEAKKNMNTARTRFLSAMNLLTNQSTVNPDKVAAIGYCFGGGIVLEMARMGVDLDGVVSFHGSLTTRTPAEKGKIKSRILVMNGADDPFVTKEQIDTFKKEMHKAGADFKFINYPGAKHSFTNPDADTYGKKFNLPLQYNAEVDRKSWSRMQEFFKEIFQ